MSTLVLSGKYLSVRSRSRRLMIKRDGNNSAGKQRIQVPLENVDRVVISGRPEITMAALQKIIRRDIPCYFTTSRGRWVGSVVPAYDRNGPRRLKQYQACLDHKLCIEISRDLVVSKILNSRRVLGKLISNRRRGDAIDFKPVITELKTLAARAAVSNSHDNLRGCEGRAAALYFGTLRSFFPDKVPFTGRRRRPAPDRVNSLLSYSYAILQGELDAAIRSHGLDPSLGFLHSPVNGRPSLTLDLMEPLRAPVCDRLVLSIFNLGIFGKDDFETHCDGGCRIRPGKHSAFFEAWEKALTRRFSIPEIDNSTDFRGVIERQVIEIVRAVEGKERRGFFRLP